VTSSCGHSNKTSGSIKDGIFNQVSNYQLLKDFVPWSQSASK